MMSDILEKSYLSYMMSNIFIRHHRRKMMFSKKTSPNTPLICSLKFILYFAHLNDLKSKTSKTRKLHISSFATTLV